ncbi:MAG: DUF1653 domain-containing protein [Candidatus Kerfeldbacteria bacterium]|nr:DUF1653 domain-containing protein [Candidatus Kerfeldbacteria bacterium]
MNEPVPAWSSAAQQLQPGEYEHYKGNHYRVIGVAHHSETLAELVVYQALYGDHSIWVRPVEMFTGTVTVDGVARPRFLFLHT